MRPMTVNTVDPIDPDPATGWSRRRTMRRRRRLAALGGHLATGRCSCAAPPMPSDERTGAELADGLSASQVAHYKHTGFVVLRGLYDPLEVADIREEFEHLLEHCPAERGSAVDKHGRPVPGGSGSYYNFTDPDGGDDPRTFNATKVVLNRVNDPLSFAPAVRTAYGSPRLLACAASIYGADVVPFGQSHVLKPPRDGAGFSWHQDTGISAEFPYDWQEERGVNFGTYLHPSTLENGCLHVVPGSHLTKKDIAALVSENKGKMLPGAVAVPVNPGDAIVHARNVVHGSFPNTSESTRCTLYFGFHPFDAVSPYYDAEEIIDRQRQIPLAVALRSQVAKTYLQGEEAHVYGGLSTTDDPVMQLCARSASMTSAELSSAAAQYLKLFDGQRYPNLQI